MCIYLIKQLKDGATVDRMNKGGVGKEGGRRKYAKSCSSLHCRKVFLQQLFSAQPMRMLAALLPFSRE